MTSEQRKAQRKYDKWESTRRRMEMRRRLQDALSKLPTSSQLVLPLQLNGQVPMKALILLNDELLTELSLRQLPIGARVTPKVLKVFGSEPSLMPPKARSLIVGGVEATLQEPKETLKRRRRRSSTRLSNLQESLNDSMDSMKRKIKKLKPSNSARFWELR